MKQIVITTFLFFIFPYSAWSENRFGLSSDVGLPFRLTQEGAGNSGRENFYLGLDAKHWFSQTMNWGVRFQMDLDRYQGAYRKMGISPGFAQHWMPSETIHPFFRFEVPYLFSGAPNTHGKDDQQDLGVGGGAGISWKVKNTSLSVQYDFGFHYFFGIGDALSEVSIDLFRMGLNYIF